VHPSYSSSSSVNDIAVVSNGSGWGAPADTSASWLRLVREAPTGGTGFGLYGWGMESDSGPMDHLKYFLNHFEAGPSNSILLSPVVSGRACAGDSGAPLIRYANSGMPYPAVWAVHTATDDRTGYCAEAGDTEIATWVGSKVSWISGLVTGGCTNYSTGGVEYARCW
jgi:secreted trypsin-like serine protease